MQPLGLLPGGLAGAEGLSLGAVFWPPRGFRGLCCSWGFGGLGGVPLPFPLGFAYSAGFLRLAASALISVHSDWHL